MLLTLIWGFGFGWVSRRFERQADVYGVRCIAEGLALCPMPCRVHGEAGSLNGDLLCSTAADRFAETLHSVAELNGIPPEARSWRHSSIASRMRFLRHLAQAPDDLQRFDRLLWRIKAFLLVFSLVGGAITVKVYWPAELFGFDL